MHLIDIISRTFNFISPFLTQFYLGIHTRNSSNLTKNIKNSNNLAGNARYSGYLAPNTINSGNLVKEFGFSFREPKVVKPFVALSFKDAKVGMVDDRKSLELVPPPPVSNLRSRVSKYDE